MKELWENDRTTSERFRVFMSINRFRFLLKTLRFDDTDNLTLICKVFEEFIGYYQENYLVEEYLTIDEILEAFRGRCKFQQYITKRPAKYGLKM